MRERMKRLKHPRLRILAETLYDVQKLRIATSNRLVMYEEKLDIIPPILAAKLHAIVSDLEREEASLLAMVEEELEAIPVWQWLKTIKGIGAAMAGGVIARIDDISKSPHVSSLWRLAGLHVENGEAPRRRRGEKAPWDWKLRSHMWKVRNQLLRARNEFYTDWYNRYKSHEVKKCEEKGIRIVPSSGLPKDKDGNRYEPEGVISRGHVDNRAKRKVAKLFLANLWHVWRNMEGLPTTPPYAAKLGHKIILPPNWCENCKLIVVGDTCPKCGAPIARA
jgi:hypothetical protein